MRQPLSCQTGDYLANCFPIALGEMLGGGQNVVIYGKRDPHGSLLMPSASNDLFVRPLSLQRRTHARERFFNGDELYRSPLYLGNPLLDFLRPSVFDLWVIFQGREKALSQGRAFPGAKFQRLRLQLLQFGTRGG